ncbi:hypothetical protein [Geodermatophilus poikilotrophus]|uniref:Uncharacterized protein n=1 Tax=Geodermatophilus poikilotrophus TaxID=1333667 RepID=A0A1H9ZU92_9ACTN|nr:hypothetical protein [Geodermatophilus poikilotrophus]SES85324.1 hypothetical protein SAMN04488546_0782 [Geodermatophilus poikilotrophus]
MSVVGPGRCAALEAPAAAAERSTLGPPAGVMWAAACTGVALLPRS